jgi:hypothetical protein
MNKITMRWVGVQDLSWTGLTESLLVFLVPTRLRGNAVWTRQRPVFRDLVPTPARLHQKKGDDKLWLKR